MFTRADWMALAAVWPSPQIEASRMAWATSASRATSICPTARQPGERLVLADRAHPARHALAARFVAEEVGDPPQHRHHVGPLVEDADHPGAERDPGGGGALEGQFDPGLIGADEGPRRSTQQDRLGRRSARPAQQFGEVEPVGHLVHTGSARPRPTGRTAGSRSTRRCRWPRTPPRRPTPPGAR